MKRDVWKTATIILGAFLLIAVGIFIGNQFNENKTTNENFWGNLPFFKSETQLDGEIFIVTKGRANIKFGLVLVTVTDINDKCRKIISETKTNSDGRFSLKLPYGAYEIQATASRNTFGDTEAYNWSVPIVLNQEKQSITLSNDNYSSLPPIEPCSRRIVIK